MQSGDRDLNLYRTMLVIRRAEEKIREHYNDNEMKTPVHLAIGQEAVAAGVCDALGPQDQILGTYRSHGIFLARTGDTLDMFLELYGKATARAKGKAGSMHLSSPEHGFLGTSAVVGTTIPVAVGAALANQRQKNGKTVAVMFGDGAIDEGAFWESVNFACVMKLPVVFVCEDNGLAIHTAAEVRHGYDSVAKVVERFRIHVAASDSTDPVVLSDLTREAIRQHRETGRPAFLHFQCYRYMEHVGINEDFSAGYRTRASFEKWLERDPIALMAKRLRSKGVSQEKLDALLREIDADLARCVEVARKAPFPKPSELWEDVLA